MNAAEVGNLVARILEALVWPVVLIIFLLLFRSQIVSIIERVSKIKIRDFEAEFGRDLRDAEQKAKDAEIPPPQDIKQATEPITIASSYDRLFELAAWSPRAAIMEAWLRVEASIEEAASALRIKPRARRVGEEIIVELVRREKLPQEIVSVYDSLRRMRNQSVHDTELTINPKSAHGYVNLALGVALQIRNALRK